MAHRRVRVGLDAFAATLLKPVDAIIFPALDSELEAGHPGCWLSLAQTPLPLRMPEGGRLTRINKHLQECPRLAAEDPYETGWLLEVTPDPETEGNAGYQLDAAAIKINMEADWTSFMEQVVSSVERDISGVGPTLQDGGERLKDISMMLGPRQYRELVLKFL